MSDERRDFGEFYPRGGIASGTAIGVPPVVQDLEARARLDAAAAAAAALPDVGEVFSVGQVKTAAQGVKDVLEGL